MLFEGVELVIEALYLHTNFHKLGQKLFRRKIESVLTTKQEDSISKLSVKIQKESRGWSCSRLVQLRLRRRCAISQ